MIVITGGEGFIGKNLVNELKLRGYTDIVVLDVKSIDIILILDWIINNEKKIECIFHLGAITDTTETNFGLLNTYNTSFSKAIFSICTRNNIPLIYASSAATYGNGDDGFDDEKSIKELKPLNEYGRSKQFFDTYVVRKNTIKPDYWYGLKFFNVYGHGEAHKGAMASVVFHFYNQIKNNGKIKLFKSHRDGIVDGEQKRDFIYVDDIVDVCIYMYENKPESGIYNVGTGKARSYNDLAKNVFKCLGVKEDITYIDTPIEIRENYQYFTEAKMNKLLNIGYSKNFNSLEDGIFKYINKLNHENR